MAIFKYRDRQARKTFKAHHAAAMKSAQECYDLCEPGGIVTREFEEGEYHVITAATPSREAWETYFDCMVEFGEDPWKGKDLFDKELKR